MASLAAGALRLIFFGDGGFRALGLGFRVAWRLLD